MCRDLDASEVCENRRHTRGYVEANFIRIGREPLMRKRSVQIELKIAQLRYYINMGGRSVQCSSQAP
jgi:hypothetical protein